MWNGWPRTCTRSRLPALRWPDIDLTAATVFVTAALEQRVGRKARRAETKTSRSRRVVPLDSATIEASRDHRTRAIESGLACGRSYDTTSWVFRRSRGDGPLSMSIIWKAWRQLAVRAGVRLV